MSDFQGKLQALCAKELADSKKGGATDHDRQGDMFGALAEVVGFTAVILSRGQSTTIDTLMEGFSAEAHRCAVEQAPMARRMAEMGI